MTKETDRIIAGIPFTQYLRPNGRPKEVYIDLGIETENKAQQLIDCGCRFDIEILLTGIVSMTCEQGDELLAMELAPNGPEIPGAVKRLIDSALAKLPSPSA